jgi:signal transduction histidine kinase
LRVTGRGVPWEPPDAARVLLAFGGCALTAVTLTNAAGAPATSYAGTHAVSAVALGAAILALVSAAVTAESRRVAALASTAAVAITLPVWAGTASPGAVRALADGLVPAAPALLIALALGGRGDRAARRVAAATLVTAAIVAAARMLLRDPVLDVGCFADCSPNPLAIAHADAAVSIVDQCALVALTGLAAYSAALMRRRARDIAGPVLIAAGLALRFAALAADPVERAADTPLAAAYTLAIAGAVAVGAVMVADVLSAVLARRAARQLVGELRMDATLPQIEAGLSAAARDPDLKVLPAGHAARGRAMLPVLAGGAEVARIAHDNASRRALERALGPAVRLAIANAVLRERLEARIDELRETRARIVAHGDGARERLERDLHDGAQQGLLAALYDLQLAAAQACGTRNADALEDAADEVAGVLDELRELAHGIHPTVLAQAGLRPALDSLAVSAPITVEITEAPARRYALETELAAYRLADEAVRNAAEHGRPRSVVISVRERDGTLVVRAVDDGVGGATIGEMGGLAEVADRVGTCGGALTLDSPPGRGTTLHGVIPCA